MFTHSPFDFVYTVLGISLNLFQVLSRSFYILVKFRKSSWFDLLVNVDFWSGVTVALMGRGTFYCMYHSGSAEWLKVGVLVRSLAQDQTGLKTFTLTKHRGYFVVLFEMFFMLSSPEPEDGPSIDGLSTSPKASIGESFPVCFSYIDFLVSFLISFIYKALF